MLEKDLKILETSLEKKESKLPMSVVKVDFRELRAMYVCTAESEFLEGCLYYAPGAMGNCTFKDEEFCKKEVG